MVREGGGLEIGQEGWMDDAPYRYIHRYHQKRRESTPHQLVHHREHA